MAFVHALSGDAASIDGDPIGGASSSPAGARDGAAHGRHENGDRRARHARRRSSSAGTPRSGRAILLDAIAEADPAGFTEQRRAALNNLGGLRRSRLRHHGVRRHLPPQAIDFCVAHNEDLWRINALALAARNALDQGRWTEAADLADRILQDPRDSPWPHHEALVVLALVRRAPRRSGRDRRARRSRGRRRPAGRGRRAPRPGAAARAEVAWLEQRPDVVADATDAMLAAARSSGRRRRQPGCSFRGASPASRSRTGSPERRLRSRVQRRLGQALRPSGTRLSLPVRGSPGAPRDERRGAAVPTRSRRSTSSVRSRLRSSRCGGFARSARAGCARAAKATRENAAGPDAPRERGTRPRRGRAAATPRSRDQLFLSPCTVDHHVSSLLRKLEAGSRVEAVATARRLGPCEDR